MFHNLALHSLHFSAFPYALVLVILDVLWVVLRATGTISVVIAGVISLLLILPLGVVMMTTKLMGSNEFGRKFWSSR